MNHISFETDLLKHYVRRYGWLAATRKQKNAIRKRSKRIPLRYFTFCAADAIDVFMLEKEGILTRGQESGRLEGVYFCEKDDDEFGDIANLIGSPEQGFLGEFEKIVLFEDDQVTIGKTLEDEDFYPSEIRKKLRYKDAHHRLRDAFPFDIINLDVCGVMFPPRRGIMTPLLKSTIKILEWQTKSKFLINQRQSNRFTLFLTSHIDKDDTNQQVVEQLEKRVNDNISTSEDFQSAFFNQYGHNQADRLANEKFAEFFCIAFPKYLIHRALFEFGWKVTSGPTFLYKRDYRREENKQYQIMHTVSVYERISDFQQSLNAPSTGQYIESVTQLVNDGVKWVEDFVEESYVSRELDEDLKQIIELREQRKNS